MPPIKLTKRKVDDVAAETAAPAEEVVPSAKQAFLAMMAERAPVSKAATGGTGAVNIEGIVTRVSKISVHSKKGSVPKLMINILATRVSSAGNNTVVSTGVDGVVFAMPTTQLEASPDEIAKNADAKGEAVIDNQPGDWLTNYLGSFSASFYVEAPVSGKEPPPVVLCVPGTRVVVSNVSSVLSKEGDRVYTNAKKISPLVPAFSPADAAQRMIQECMSAPVQSTAALLLSSTMNGFFGFDAMTPHQDEQAELARAKWDGMLSTAAAKCDAIAASIGADVEREPVAKAMLAHADRLRATSPGDVAAGSALFITPPIKDCVTPYVAPIVQIGMEAGNTLPGQVNDLFNPAKRDALPSSFVAGKVTAVSFVKSLVCIDYRLVFVFDRDKAIEADAVMSVGFLTHKSNAARVKLSKRSVGPELLGVVVDEKIETVLTEVMFVMDHVALTPVFPKSAESILLDGHFSSTVGFDLVSGIKKAGITVSAEWLDKSMLGGRGVYIYGTPEGATLIEPQAGTAPSPTLSTMNYQAISETSFDFDSLKPGEGKSLQFYLLYKGVRADVEAKGDLAKSTDAGEAHVPKATAAIRADGDVKAFLKQDCVVYAVAV